MTRPDIKVHCPATKSQRTFRFESETHTASYHGHCSLCGDWLALSLEIVGGELQIPRDVSTVCGSCIVSLFKGKWPSKTFPKDRPVPDLKAECDKQPPRGHPAHRQCGEDIS